VATNHASLPSAEQQAALLQAADFFAKREVYGLVWMDADLIVRGRYGAKAAFITVGTPITDSVFPFIGSEDFIVGLQSDPTQSLELPGVVIVISADTQDRYNLSLFWSPEQHRYLMLIARASLDATLEVELLRHVRARLMAEAEIKAKSDELARANRDLEDFAAIVSHDLKAPMRALQYMTDEIDSALSGSRLTEAKTQISWVRGQTRRMASMLTSLLDYSTIGRKARALEMINTKAVAEGIALSLGHSSPYRVSISGEWPVIQTLRAPLDLVLRNLVDNAIKHHDRPSGSIVMGCAARGEALILTVCDDGAGIAEEHALAIFKPFRTLVVGDAAASAGIGMGLALVERTVESVGGSIRLVPRTDGGGHAQQRGATFEVMWPCVLDFSSR
jgi:signal transduction histidine kinase